MNLFGLFAVVFSSFTFGFVMRGLSKREEKQDPINKRNQSLIDESILDLKKLHSELRERAIRENKYMCHHVFERKIFKGWKPERSWVEVRCQDDKRCPVKE